MDPKTKKTLAILVGLALFAVVLVFGVNEVLKRLTPESETKNMNAPVLNNPSGNMKIENPSGGKDTKVKIINQDNAPTDTRPVMYSASGFAPTTITIKISDSIGCLITVTNKTASPLKVGVSPHNRAGDPGANYGELQPNETGIFDVRYTGLASIMLHDHAKPENEFTVDYGEGCH